MYYGYARFWIKFSIIDISQGPEYALNFEYTSATQGSVENSQSYIFDRFLSFPWALNMLGLKYTRAVIMPRLNMVLCKLYFKDSQYCMSWVLNILRFWIYHESKYAILQGSEWNTSSYSFDRVLNIPRFQNMLGFWIY